MFKKLKSFFDNHPVLLVALLMFTYLLIGGAIFVLIFLLGYYVNELFYLLAIPPLIYIFIDIMKNDAKFIQMVKKYELSGYKVEHREGRTFEYKKLLDEDDERLFIIRHDHGHCYTINHIEREIHIYK